MSDSKEKNDIITLSANLAINGLTVKQIAEKLGKSESSIKKYLAKFRRKTFVNYDPELVAELRKAQEKKVNEGRILGGQTGRRTSSITEEEKIRLAEMYMSGPTYEDLSILTGIPKSTLQELIRSIKDEEVQRRLDEYVNGERKRWRR